ncbi:hypothetical protein GOZ98_26820 [Agrobacterium vitis]|nr:hypothetical protein [Agrobacterium vitis]
MIVVYGAFGMIGRLVVADLKELGHEVASVDIGYEEVFTPTVCAASIPLIPRVCEH